MCLVVDLFVILYRLLSILQISYYLSAFELDFSFSHFRSFLVPPKYHSLRHIFQLHGTRYIRTLFVSQQLRHEFHFCSHWYILCIATSTEEESDGPSLIIMAPNNNGYFSCFNVNCYAWFKTKQGLKQHSWRSESCGQYMSEPRPALASCMGIVHESTWRQIVMHKSFHVCRSSVIRTL
jgi:hypothetical protein